MANKQFDNMEEVVKEFNKKLKALNIIKYNGITIRATIPGKRKFETIKKELEYICNEYKLIPYSIEQIELYDERFIVTEFPEFEPYYTEEENLNMYKNSINYLLEQTIKNSEFIGQTVTKQMLLNDSMLFTTEAIKIYYKSNVNTYKVDIKEFLDNKEYVGNINKLTVVCINELDIK